MEGRSEIALRLLAKKISRLTVKERVRLWTLLREADGLGDDEGGSGVREPRHPIRPESGLSAVLPKPASPEDYPTPFFGHEYGSGKGA